MSDIEIRGDGPDIGHAMRIIRDEATSAMRRGVLTVEAEWKGRLAPGRGYRTGHYARSITSQVNVSAAGEFGFRIEGSVGTNVFYARYLEEGTGLYGPFNRWIVPKRAKALRFPEPGNRGFTLAGRRRSGRAGAMAKYVYAKRVRGIRPRRYAYDAALISRPKVEAIFRLAGARAAARLSR